MLTREQLTAARSAAAVGPVLAPAFLRFTGRDARSYLHRMSTQDLASLPPGGAAHAAFLTAKGHLLCDALVRADEGGLLAALPAEGAAAARAHLERFVIMDDVAVAAEEGLRALPLLGPEGPARLGGRAGGALRAPNLRRGAPCLDLWLPAGEAAALREALAADGLPALGEEELEALRVAGGVARFGADVDGSRLPMEAGLTRDAISFTKGCYIGQEVVVRATARGQLQRGLAQLRLPPGAGPGTPLLSGGAEVGKVTSAAETPDGRMGLGWLRRAYSGAGQRLQAGDGEVEVLRSLVVEE
jgi:tRNA-modifying protein YgfZ